MRKQRVSKKGRVHVGKHRTKWRAEVYWPNGIGPDGEQKARSRYTFPTKEQAEAFARVQRKAFVGEGQTVSEAIDAYHADMVARGLKPSHTETTWFRLQRMFRDSVDIELSALSQWTAHDLYDELRKDTSVDFHRNTLNQCKTFGKWMVKKGWISENPWESIEGVGRRKRGKKQLTIDESRKLYAYCLASDEPGATATLCCLLLGLTSSEVAAITSRHIDDNGRLWRVGRSEAKSLNRERVLVIPEALRARLEALIAYPKLSRHWVYRQAKRNCRLAGVPIVCPHGLRGTHGSLAAGAGATSEIVSNALGHGGTAVTERHYVRKDALDAGRQQAALRVLDGGVQ